MAAAAAAVAPEPAAHKQTSKKLDGLLLAATAAALAYEMARSLVQAV